MVRSLSLQNSACIESYNLANYILSTFNSLSNKTSVHCDVLLSWSPLPREPKNYFLLLFSDHLDVLILKIILKK
jgi:hypothetical protein